MMLRPWKASRSPAPLAIRKVASVANDHRLADLITCRRRSLLLPPSSLRRSVHRTRLNSRLLVTTVKSWVNAIAAMRRSFGPMISPRLSSESRSLYTPRGSVVEGQRPEGAKRALDSFRTLVAFLVLPRAVQEFGPDNRAYGNIARGRLPQASLHWRAGALQVTNPCVRVQQIPALPRLARLHRKLFGSFERLVGEAPRRGLKVPRRVSEGVDSSAVCRAMLG